MINIEDDEVTCNSYVVFAQTRKENKNFIYVDRHGNWILGTDVGKAKGFLRSNPDDGQHIECPCKVKKQKLNYFTFIKKYCQVSSWQTWDFDNKMWTPTEEEVTIFKYKLYAKSY